ncbi:unnamed protein product [Mytilus edulis]|uniref:Uncharacterized protein n=1 Tax=Mytilus edulis TaxID=6550 RepID=A0A8S3TJX4_MYTED|nr:unnamed protein product [Mytilus edulis]
MNRRSLAHEITGATEKNCKKMGNYYSKSMKDPLMSEKCRSAREKIKVSREKFLLAVKEECDKSDDDIDAPYGFFSMIPNIMSKYGWHPGAKLMDFLGKIFSMKTGDPDITFAEVYKKFGNELCIIITNVNTMSEEYCHVKTTPDMPVRLAVRMSMSIPGWWLSMDPKDSFLKKIQPIRDIASLMDRKNRFQSGTESTKTLGSIIADSEKYCKFLFGEGVGPDLAYDALDRDGNGSQGKRSTLKYLQHFICDNNLAKVSEEEINARDIPSNPSITDAQLELIANM